MTVAVDVRDLLDHPGASRTVQVREPVPGLATEVASVPEDHPVAAELLIESVVEGLLVTGPLEGTMVLVCARCLNRRSLADVSATLAKLASIEWQGDGESWA